MKPPEFAISWVDLVTALVILIGILRGRKRGLSEELLDTLQWLAIVVGAAYGYRELANVLNQNPIMSLLTYQVLSYILIALVIKGLFTVVKKRIGQKLVEGDMFGRGEFYLGMAAGSLRWICMYFFILSLLHAPAYSAEFRKQKAQQDEYNFGDISFPSIMSLQDEVYTRSYTGKSAEAYLGHMLMHPASAESKQLRGSNSMAKRREREVDAVVIGK